MSTDRSIPWLSLSGYPCESVAALIYSYALAVAARAFCGWAAAGFGASTGFG
jgi:hypothetical protein